MFSRHLQVVVAVFLLMRDQSHISRADIARHLRSRRSARIGSTPLPRREPLANSPIVPGVARPGTVAHLALVFAIVNVAACLIADRAMTAGRGSKPAIELDRGLAATADADAARLVPLTLMPASHQSRIPGRVSAQRNPF